MLPNLRRRRDGLRIATFVVSPPQPSRYFLEFSKERDRCKPVAPNRDIYPNLKLRIFTAGIRQNRLAKMVGIDEAYLSKIINGFREPSGDVRGLIAKALDSDPEWLFQKIQVGADMPYAGQSVQKAER